jgi:hypothetical protein
VVFHAHRALYDAQQKTYELVATLGSPEDS